MLTSTLNFEPKRINLTNLKPSYPRLFYWLILINVIIDIFAFWSEPAGATAILRVVILYGAFFYFLLIKKIRFEKNIYIIIFSIYVLLQLFIAVDLDYSLKISLQIITSLLMFFVGYALIKNEFDFYYYLKQFFWVYVVIIVNTIVSNVFNIGIDDYTKSTDYVVGGLNDLWNIYTYSLMMLPLLVLYKIQKKWLLYICAFLVLIFLMISLKRIAIIGVAFAGIIFLIFLGLKRKMVRRVVIFFALIAITSPFYTELLKNRIEVRSEQGRFESKFYESEPRYLEIGFLIKQVSEFKNPLEILFGLRAFDSRGVVDNEKRQFHIDFTLITYSMGLVGFGIYMLIYLKLISDFKKMYKNMGRFIYHSTLYKTQLVTIFVLILSSLLTSIGGQMYHLTFRMIVFMTIGSIFQLTSLKLKELKRLKIMNKRIYENDYYPRL